jgi:ribonuclease-3
LIADASTLSRLLGHAFTDRGLLEEALRHRSAGARHNERLEFLGDSLLNAVVAAALYRRYPQATEGRLSRLRASLVNQEALAGVARELELGQYLQLGTGELRSGGGRRASILADALEAVLGAVYLDGGFEACERVVLGLLGDRLGELEAVASKDPKTKLQEWLQSRRLPLPSYQVRGVFGEPHEQHFVVECLLGEVGRSATGEGSSRRKAEQQAAHRVLEQLGETP